MKRSGNLYKNISELENLELAFWKAQRGKSAKKAVINFRRNLSQNLKEIRMELLGNRVRMGDYHFFTIYDPKKRTICAAPFRERIIQHAVVNLCKDRFEKFQIYDSYACRKGKGMDACLNRALKFCKRFKWYLKIDIHKYYDSINHRILLELLGKLFKDKELLFFFSNLIDTYEVTPGRGIPIGNLLSQYFANMYLAVFDHEIKDRLRIKGYIRYMDDCLVFSDEKTELVDLELKIKDFVRRRLDLELNRPQLNRCVYGIPFLSYRVYPDRLRLSLKAKKRFCKGIKEADRAENSEKALALLAFVNRADSLDFRKRYLSYCYR